MVETKANCGKMSETLKHSLLHYYISVEISKSAVKISVFTWHCSMIAQHVFWEKLLCGSQ